MTDRHTLNRNRSEVNMSAVIPWINDSGDTIPAYGVVQIRTDHDTNSIASKPDSTSGLFFPSGPAEVQAGAYGESLVWSHPRRVLISGTPTVGDEVGPISDSWEMSSSGSGFRVLLQPTDGVGVVVQVGGGSSSHQHGIVVAQLTRGYYTIRLSDWSAEALPDTGTEETLCENLAEQVDIVDETYSDCTITQTLPEFGEVEDGSTHVITTRQTTAQDPVVEVTAFHRASLFVPLALWSEVLITNLGDEIDGEKIYQVVDGFQEHIIAYDKTYECCTETGEWKLVSRTPYIFAAVMCSPDSCEPCPEPA